MEGKDVTPWKHYPELFFYKSLMLFFWRTNGSGCLEQTAKLAILFTYKDTLSAGAYR